MRYFDQHDYAGAITPCILKRFDRVRAAFSVLYAVSAVAALSGCGRSPVESGYSLPSQTSQFSENAAAGRSGSWMAPEASSEDLLYVTNYYEALVFTYPQGKLVGTLKNFYSAVGECVDAKGDVFITNFKPTVVYEYAHGGTKRIATFLTKKGGSVGCAIDPTTGDLAVSGFTNAVEIFKQAKGKPSVVRDPGMFFGQYCTYDNNGNLFFDGLASASGKSRLSELPANSHKFVGMQLNAPFDPESGIEWDGTYLTAVWNPLRKKAHIYQFAIHGDQGKKVGATPINKAQTVLQYFIFGNTLIAPNLKGFRVRDVLFYDYPSGGVPTMELTKKITEPRGVVVSVASGVNL